jgi:hypothetical protein
MIYLNHDLIDYFTIYERVLVHELIRIFRFVLENDFKKMNELKLYYLGFISLI